MGIFHIGGGFVLSSTEKVKAFVLSHPRALLKAPWSGSGRGIQYVSGSFTIPLEGGFDTYLPLSMSDRRAFL